MHEADLISRDLLNTLKRRASKEVHAELLRLRAENRQLWNAKAEVARLKSELGKLRSLLNRNNLVASKILEQYKVLQTRLDTKISYRLRNIPGMVNSFHWYSQAGRALKSLKDSKWKGR